MWTIEYEDNLHFYKCRPKNVGELRQALAEIKFMKGNEMVYLSDDGEITVMVVKDD